MLTTVRRDQPTGQPSGLTREAALAALAAGLYIVSTIKYQTRDPLSTQAGFQAVLEIGCVCAAVALAAMITVPRTLLSHITPTVTGLILFTVLSLVSSVFSFFPQLSIIKGALLLATIALATLLCAARPPKDILAYVYWSVVGVVVAGTVLRLISSAPLFDEDEYSGRMRFTLFALHYGSLADFVAYVFLVGRLLPRPPHWLAQSFLVAVNLAAGARASTGALLVVLIIGWLSRQKMTARAAANAAFGVAAAALIALIAVNATLSITSIPWEQFYGDKVTVDEIVTLNNRTGLWAASMPMVPGSLVFGYGVEGMRAALLQEFDWAGHSHNAYLELLFAAGLPGLLSFMVAWGAGVLSGFRIRSDLRLRVLSLHVYMFMCGLTDPNLLLLQFFPIFLIVCLDACARAEALPETVVEPQAVVSGHAPRQLVLQLGRRTNGSACRT